jgi:hypothetical protein
MRLLLRSNTGEFSLTGDLVGDDTIPPYAILSHTWEDGQEVIFKDLVNGTGQSKTGYDKVRFCGQQAERDGLRYFWVDTCCIDKSNHVELQDFERAEIRKLRDVLGVISPNRKRKRVPEGSLNKQSRQRTDEFLRETQRAVIGLRGLK